MIITINVTRMRLVIAIAVSIVVATLLDPWIMGRNRPERARQIRSSREFKAFAQKVKQFQQETGSYPTNCVQLIGTNKLELISDYLPRLEYTGFNPIKINDSQIDIDSLVAYTIFCKNKILVYEKRNVWSDGKVWVCYDDMTFARMPYKKLVKQLEGSKTP